MNIIKNTNNMETKIKQVNELMELLGVTQEDMINSWLTSTPNQDLVGKMETLIQNEKNSPVIFGLSDITKIEPGMIWYEDDTFSFSVIKDKRIKAVVDLVDAYENYIYGDLTASTIYDIQERYLKYHDALVRLDNLSSICKEGEKVVLLSGEKLGKIASCYDKTKETLLKLGKSPRKEPHMSFTLCAEYTKYFRPTLRVLVKRSSF